MLRSFPNSIINLRFLNFSRVFFWNKAFFRCENSKFCSDRFVEKKFMIIYASERKINLPWDGEKMGKIFLQSWNSLELNLIFLLVRWRNDIKSSRWKFEDIIPWRTKFTLKINLLFRTSPSRTREEICPFFEEQEETRSEQTSRKLCESSKREWN